VATAIAARVDLIAPLFGFRADFEVFAAFFFLAMVTISSRKAR
jgi:hypothetical protein